MSGADNIREYAYEHFIKPSRARGLSVVAIASRDVHNGLELDSKFPNVCQALSGEKFYSKYGLSILETLGPNPSSTTVFVYKM